MKPRPEWCAKAPLSERVMLWLSSGKRIDGLWVGTYFQTNAGAVMLRIEEALRLIKVHDRRRYRAPRQRSHSCMGSSRSRSGGTVRANNGNLRTR